jgi:hypothetical protein
MYAACLVTAAEVGPLITLPSTPISTRSGDPGSEAGRIAELEKELVRLKGSQEEEEDHRHDPHLGELFPTRSVTLALINHEGKTSDRADGFNASLEERPEPGHGQRQRMAPPPWRSRAGPEAYVYYQETHTACLDRRTQRQRSHLGWCRSREKWQV